MSDTRADVTAHAGTDRPGFPQHWLADVLASDGGVVHLRPILPEDAEAIVKFHTELSDRSRYLRYFGPHPRLSDREVQHEVVVDHRNRVALVLVLGGEIIGVGRYERIMDDQGSRSAEVAFVVSDSHQSRGLGSILLEHLAGAAAENGIETFIAEVLAENRGMIMVFREAGYQIKRSLDGSVMHLEFAIDPTDALLTVRESRERASEARSVRNLLAPRSVAVIGASATTGKVGRAVLDNLLAAGFTGPVFPVNANNASVRGVRAYATVRDIPDDVDLAVIAVPPDAIGGVLDDCLAKGVKGLVVLTAGFAELGTPVGVEAEQNLIHEARGHGMRVVGPSALGIANNDPAVSLNATLANVLPARGRIGFFCQSGPLGATILAEAAQRGVGVSTFVSAGNRADVSGNDVLQYWDADPDTDVVLLYIESFGNPRKFSRIGRRLARTKPVVVVSGGREPRAAASSARLRVQRDLFAESGMIQVESIIGLFDCAVLLGYQPLPAGPRVVVIGNTAALCRMAVDAAEADGLDPVDVVNLGPEGTPDDYASAIAAAVSDDRIDAALVIFSPPLVIDADRFATAIKQASAGSPKPILTSFAGLSGMPDALAVLDEAGVPTKGSIPSYLDPLRAAGALARVRRYADWRSRPVSNVVRPDGVDTENARALVADWLTAAPEGRWLDDLEAVHLLACFGIQIVEFREVNSAAEAVAAAEELGYPVAAKATGEMWRRRIDLDGVRLDLTSPESVEVGYTDLATISGHSLVHVQTMAAKGIGCTLSVGDDPAFGSVIAFGLSGVIMDLLDDRAYRALPLTQESAKELIDSPRTAPLLDGHGHTAPVDKGALVDLASRISAMCDDIPDVRQLICEPVLASAAGAGVIYARVRIGPETTRVDLGPRRLR
ncbi:MAG TPA: GNAT family N-acetyltransferase [Aldersonia sp.]